MSASSLPRPYLSVPVLEDLRGRLSVRDIEVVESVGELRLLSGRQIQALHFPAEQHASRVAAVRACHRVLRRLVDELVLVRLGRRDVGGVHAGSASFIYALGPAGQRLLRPAGPRRRLFEPTGRFVDHTLATAQIVVDVAAARRAGVVGTLSYEAEPACWRPFAGTGTRLVLKPDLSVVVDAGDYRLRWFVETDRSSEALTVIVRKSQLYTRYYQTGREQAHGDGAFPRVLWVAPDERRARAIRTAIEREKDLPEGLFLVTTSEQAASVIAGGAA